MVIAMTPRRRKRWIRYGLLAALLFGYYFLIGFRLPFSQNEEALFRIVGQPSSQQPSSFDFSSLTWREEQCKAAFPGLTKDIDDMMALGPFTLKQARNMGPLQAQIQDGQV